MVVSNISPNSTMFILLRKKNNKKFSCVACDFYMLALFKLSITTCLTWIDIKTRQPTNQQLSYLVSCIRSKKRSSSSADLSTDSSSSYVHMWVILAPSWLMKVFSCCLALLKSKPTKEKVNNLSAYWKLCYSGCNLEYLPTCK